MNKSYFSYLSLILTLVFSFNVELRATWNSEKQLQEDLQKQLEETEYAQAQLSKCGKKAD